MKNRLSHSSVSMYQSCGKKYEFHYKYRLRSKYTSAALLFGSAVDKAMESMLKSHGTLDFDWLGQIYRNVFTNNWRRAKINDVEQDLIDNENIVYAASDMDFKLFSTKDLTQILGAIENVYGGVGVLPNAELENVRIMYDKVLERKESVGWENLASNERKFYNYVNWLCLHKKGELMIQAYMTEIIPKIKKVLAVQRMVETTNTEGDSIVGYVDLVAEWEDGRIVVFDNKTSAREYEKDAVLESPQLTSYVYALENEFKTRNAGYIVVYKNIDKDSTKKCSKCGHNGTGGRAKTCDNGEGKDRCKGEWIEVLRPKARIGVLINEIPANVETLVMENYDEINHAIKAEVFTRNLSACKKPFPCPFYEKCWNGTDKSIVKLEEK